MRTSALRDTFRSIALAVALHSVAAAYAQPSVDVRLRTRAAPDRYDPAGDAVVYGFDTSMRAHRLSVGLRVSDSAGRPLTDLSPDDITVSLNQRPLIGAACELYRACLSDQPLSLTLVFKAGWTMAPDDRQAPLEDAIRLASELLDQLDRDTLITIVVARSDGPDVLLEAAPNDQSVYEKLQQVGHQSVTNRRESDVCSAIRTALERLGDTGDTPPSDRCCLLVFADGRAPEQVRMDCGSDLSDEAEARGIPIFAVRVGHGRTTTAMRVGLRQLCEPTRGRLLETELAATIAQELNEAVANDWIVAVDVPEAILPTDGQAHTLGLAVYPSAGTEPIDLPFFTALRGWEWVTQRYLMILVPILLVLFAVILVLALARRRRMYQTPAAAGVR